VRNIIRLAVTSSSSETSSSDSDSDDAAPASSQKYVAQPGRGDSYPQREVRHFFLSVSEERDQAGKKNRKHRISVFKNKKSRAKYNGSIEITVPNHCP
jgi:hypothetical protein